MNKSEVVWRTLAEAALDGKREWPDLRSLSAMADVPISTVHQAIRRLVEIGAISTQHRGGLTVRSPEKLLIFFSARRNLDADVHARTTLAEAQRMMHIAQEDVYLGGADAAAHWLGGINNIADKGVRVLYVESKSIPDDLDPGIEALILKKSSAGAAQWTNGFTDRAQTYADLFALPGWQASEFRQALHEKYFQAPDWDQRGSSDA